MGQRLCTSVYRPTVEGELGVYGPPRIYDFSFFSQLPYTDIHIFRESTVGQTA